MDDAPKVSIETDVPTMSALVEARRSLLSNNQREKSGSSKQEFPTVLGRFPGSINEVSKSPKEHEKQQGHLAADSQQKEDGRTSSNDPVLVSSWTLYFTFSSKLLIFFSKLMCNSNIHCQV